MRKILIVVSLAVMIIALPHVLIPGLIAALWVISAGWIAWYALWGPNALKNGRELLDGKWWSEMGRVIAQKLRSL